MTKEPFPYNSKFTIGDFDSSCIERCISGNYYFNDDITAYVDNGMVRTTKSGLLYSIHDIPARQSKNYFSIWYKNGKNHREVGPGHILITSFTKRVDFSYYLNDYKYDKYIYFLTML